MVSLLVTWSFLSSVLTIFTVTKLIGGNERSFRIDFDNNQFLKDGQPFRYISGSVHYFRIVEEYWEDRLLRMKAAGLNAIQFYVYWAVHETYPSTYDFTGNRNLTKFLDLAQQMGFVVILRPGPYINNDVDNGGLPWFLYKVKDIRTRVSDPRYLSYVMSWYNVLFPKLTRYLYKNGGPIIMIQVENEYGWSKYCDHTYMAFLRDLFRSYVGNDTVLSTVDNWGESDMSCGTVAGAHPTTDFAPAPSKEVQKYFKLLRKYAPKGPLVNTEFYPGWGSTWGQQWITGDPDSLVITMAEMYRLNASWNFFMFQGGTNFGYMAPGVDQKPYFSSILTSYDYDAPISESGFLTTKFYAIRTAVEVLSGEVISTPPPPQPKILGYGNIEMRSLGMVHSLLKLLTLHTKPVSTVYPVTFEDLNFPYGFVLYETVVPKRAKNLSVPGIGDRGYVMLDDKFTGRLVRNNQTSILANFNAGQKLRILVENQGRDQNCYVNWKGIFSNVTLDDQLLINWTMYPLQIEDVSASWKTSSKLFSFGKTRNNFLQLLFEEQAKAGFVPTIYVGQFHVPEIAEIADTFFNTSGWGKGQLFINSFNIGRYWPLVGPQITLYVPKTMLKRTNQIVMLELEKPNCQSDWSSSCHVTSIDHMII